MNHFKALLDIDSIKQEIESGETYIILLPHYSINIQSKYSDVEECDNEWNDFEDEIGHTMEVNDYDDLVIDLTESED